MSQYQIIRSARKTIGIQVIPGGKVIVRAPNRAAKADIEAVMKKHEQWITKQVQHQMMIAEKPDFTQSERLQLIARAKAYIPPRAAYYAQLMGLEHSGITVTGARTRYGSCSAKDRLCFSWRLLQYPDGVVDSVIVHELAHIRHKNHSKDFYEFVYSVMPDYDIRKKQLKGLDRQG